MGQVYSHQAAHTWGRGKNEHETNNKKGATAAEPFPTNPLKPKNVSFMQEHAINTFVNVNVSCKLA